MCEEKHTLGLDLVVEIIPLDAVPPHDRPIHDSRIPLPVLHLLILLIHILQLPALRSSSSPPRPALRPRLNNLVGPDDLLNPAQRRAILVHIRRREYRPLAAPARKRLDGMATRARDERARPFGGGFAADDEVVAG